MRVTNASVLGSLIGIILILPVTTFAEDISGLITSTRTIREHSRLVGDVTCTVTGAACIAFGAAHIDLRLNGFTISGQADATTGCGGTFQAGENGITSNGTDFVQSMNRFMFSRLNSAGIVRSFTRSSKAPVPTRSANALNSSPSVRSLS